MTSQVLFSDDVLQILLADTPSVKGHLLVKPVNSGATLASLPELDLFEFFVAASNSATALFELIGAHGTNIIVNDTNESIDATIIARTQTDGINMLWQPTQANPAELDATAKTIKDAVDLEVWARDNPQAGKKSSSPGAAPNASSTPVIKEPSPQEQQAGKKNYLLRRLRRTP